MQYSHKIDLRALTTVALIAMTAVVPVTTARAQTTVVSFNTLTESSPGAGTRFIGNCYAESGFLFTAVGLPCAGPSSLNTFIAGSANSPLFGGGTSPSLLLNSPLATLINVGRVDGARFTFSSIALAPFDGAATTIVFTGFRAGVGVSQSVTVAGNQTGFRVFSFNDFFSGVTSVQISASNEFGERLVKFDDFTALAVAGVVPEPSSVLLVGVGLFGIAIIVLRKRARA